VDLAPAGVRAKAAANLTALRLLRHLQQHGDRAATPDEQQTLARWSGWGALPKVFDEDDRDNSVLREQLRDLLDPPGWAAAARTTLNAHYTDAGLAAAMWTAVQAAGLHEVLQAGEQPVTVLEPGCGSGTFLGLAPRGITRLLGVELDPTTAAIAAKLNPHAEVRTQSFADTRLAAGSVDLVIGNVPFAKTVLTDRVHNQGRHSLHNYFILKSLALTAPGGLVAVITSHWTMDSVNPGARREIADLADLLTAVRLPVTAHVRAAGTSVVTDVLVLRRRPAGDPARSPAAWEGTRRIGGDEQQAVTVNSYFLDHPDQVLGRLGLRSGPHGPELDVTDQPAPSTDTRSTDTRGTGGAGSGSLQPTALADRLCSRLTEALSDGMAAPGASASDQPRPAPWFAPRPASGPPPALAPAPVEHLQDRIDGTAGGGFTRVDASALVEHPVPATQAQELRALLTLRDTTQALLQAESATAEDTEHIQGLRRLLNRQYDAYLRRHGPVNRVSFRRTGRVDDVTGEDRLARVSPPQGGFRQDPHSPAVYALEDYDATTGAAAKAPVFTRRVVAPRAPRRGADTPADALAICLDTHGQVSVDVIAHLLGRDLTSTRAALVGLVYPDPDQPLTSSTPGIHPAPTTATEPGHQPDPEPVWQLVPAAEYLSGDVRAKLIAARAAADTHGAASWAANVDALQAVLPADLTPAEIDGRLGAAWIDEATVSGFVRELLDDPRAEVEHAGGARWAVRSRVGGHSVLGTSTWGTPRAPAPSIVADLLQQRPVKVYDQLDDGRRLLNLTESVAAQDKAREIGERFTEWLWEDPERANTLAARYNTMFNSIVLRSYDDTQMQLPGLTVSFTPRSHQVAAVARIIAEPAVLLGHEVGAGKTAEMAIGAMELRRLGLARKPAVVVPNHMLEQFTREWMQLYPQARVLATGIDDLGAQRRRRMIARIATGDWDAVIVSRSAFERLALSPQAQHDYQDRQAQLLREQLSAVKARGGSLTVKRLEATLARAEEKLKKLLDTVKDPGITFEQTGIDYLFVDEAHGYKNLATESNIPNVAIEGSNRATDLDMKLDHLRGRHGARVATLATATPIANSVSEAYVMQRFCRPDLLQAAGLTDFDTWAATFGEVTTELELAPDGVRFRMGSRFAKFRNVPELLRMWHVSADIKTAEDLDLPTPDLHGGAPETVVVPASDALRRFMRDLAQRADRVQARQVRPDEDNMLRIASHGRAAALDLRLLPDHVALSALTALDLPAPGQDGEDVDPPDPPDREDPEVHQALTELAAELGDVGRTEGKVAAAAARIAALHHQHADRLYPGSEVPGALQLVFCDLGTPTARAGDPAGRRWNAYTELRAQLVRRGVPETGIRFAHEARNDKEKAEMFAAARNGRISVLIGSTEKMGVGTNVQARAVALHHLDCPWRPADLAQRDGRIMRQGNHNPEVSILRYVTEASFDAYLWQTVERKARFIGQVMRGRLDSREIEDVGDTAMSYAEVKALATGDPRILQKARVDADLVRLERLERSHTRNHRVLAATVAGAEHRLPLLAHEIEVLTAARDRAVDTSGDRFAMTVAGRRHTGRADAAIALRADLGQIPPVRADLGQPVPVGTLAGFTVTATRRTGVDTPYLLVAITEIPRSAFRVEYPDLRDTRPLGIVTKLENRVSDLGYTTGKVTIEHERATIEVERARADMTAGFPHAQALADARERSSRLAEELAEAASTANAAHQPAGSPPAADAASRVATTPDVTATEPTPPGARWATIAAAVDPRLPADPHWPQLARRLDLIADHGGDVPALLRHAAERRPLSAEHPGRDMEDLLTVVAPGTTRPWAPPAPAETASTTAQQAPDGGRHHTPAPAAQEPGYSL